MDRCEYQKYAARGTVNAGNRQKIRDCMKKALAGKPVKIGFLGGSVTQGSLASSPETCYAYLVYSWWKNKFPMSKVSYLNAGIGATTSQFGAARVKESLISYYGSRILPSSISVSTTNQPNFLRKLTKG